MKLRRSDAAAAIPALIQMLGSEAEFPRRILLVSSFAPITRSCSSACTFGGEAAETLARIGQTGKSGGLRTKSRFSSRRHRGLPPNPFPRLPGRDYHPAANFT